MRVILIFALVSFGLVVGCRSSEPHAATNRQPIAQQVSSIKLADAIDLWRQSSQADAVRAYVAAAEGAISDQDLLLFDMTESEYQSMTAAERNQILSDWITLSRDLRRLTRAVFDAGREASASGDQAAADRHMAAAERVGRAHAESDRVLIAQATGKAILNGLEARRNAP